MKPGIWITSLVVLAAPAWAAPAAPAAPTSCVKCHSDSGLFDETKLKIVEGFRNDVHAEAGLSCQDCHGGNPDPKLAEDPGAMDKGFKANPYHGAPARADIPALCGRCHSDPEYMKRFRPDLRVDQEREYRTSKHGQALAHGDMKVATCIDCHGVHGILRPNDPRSPVHPKRVAETCKGCHADAKRMAAYKLPDGRPLPVDQYALWRQSVHARALLERDDLSAPTCNDCHGNHGATPPGVGAIGFVCGQCHGREAELFRASAKHAGFQSHNELMAAAAPGRPEDTACASCHEPPEPQAKLKTVRGFAECTTCHGNHGIVRPTIAMLAELPATPCALCHEPMGNAKEAVPEPADKRRHYEETRDALLAAVTKAGLQGDERFDWLVDAAQSLPAHTLDEEEGGKRALRPEFARLFTKFRIGKTSFTYDDPLTGKPVRAAIVRCSDCHSASPALTEPKGLRTAAELLNGMRNLTVLTARAERIALGAQRGGVETRQALQDVDGAVDSQIELEALVHSFTADPGSPFAKKRDEGVAHAQAALSAGNRALGELAYRRKGLTVSLGLIVLVLVGLALKIREMGA